MLENNNICLRATELEDLELLYKWENNYEIWQVSNTLAPFSRHVLQQYLETAHLDIYQTKQLRLIIEIKSDNKPVGCVDLFDFEPFHSRAGVGVLINKEFQNQTYASQALELLIEYCFKHLGLHQLYCNISVENKNSLKLFQNKGFQIVGTKKDWIKTSEGWLDEYFLQLIF